MKHLNYQLLLSRFLSLNSREQWLVVAIIVLLFYAIVEFGIIGMIERQDKKIKQEIEVINGERSRISKEISDSIFNTSANKVFYSQLAQQVADLKSKLKSANDEVFYFTNGFISPREASSFVRAVTKYSTQNLRLKSIENIPTSSIEDPTAKNQAKFIYKYGFTVVTEGRYWEQVQWLRHLENLPWRIEMGKVELTADEYPKTTMTTELFTFSRESIWLSASATE